MDRPVVVPLQAIPGGASELIGGLAEVIVPPAHADARPWPHGMVIMPPATHDPIAVAIPGLVDRLLSGLLARWLAIAS